MFIGRSRKCRDMRRKRSAYGSSGAGDLDMERTVGKTERKDGECCHMTSGIGLGDNGGMTIATPERYAQMLDAARRGGYAYPAINVTSTQTLNAALQGFAEAESDGIIQVSVGGAAYFSGQRVNDRVTGSLAFAAFAHEVAAKYPNITIALHTDHCAKQYLDEWVRLLLDHEVEQVKHGQEPTFQSHMWDGSTVPLDENLDIAEELLDKSQAAHTVLEIEIGAVGGEESGHIVLGDYSKTGDALVVGLFLCLGLVKSGKKMSALFPVFAFDPFVFENIRFSNNEAVREVVADEQVKTVVEKAKKAIEGQGRVVFRPSGTEPLVRIWVGGKNEAQVQALSAEIINTVLSVKKQ